MRIKTVLTGLIVVALVLTLAGRGFTFQNEPDGFRGLKWGDPPTEEMEYFGTFEGERIYTLPDDKMSMGNAELCYIVYSFYDQPERFMLVVLIFRKEENFDLLKTICRGKFGEAAEEGFRELDWIGQKARVSLDYDIIKERGNLTIGSTQIFRESTEAQEQKEVEEAEEDW